MGERSIISDPNILLVNCLQSAFFPDAFIDTDKEITGSLINHSIINKYLVDHRSKLDTLRVIARRGDNKRLTKNDITEWSALVNPYNFEITKQHTLELKLYTLVLKQCTT